MSLAPAAYLLYQRVMRHDPADTHWLGRDRFILSAGHSSLTQYVQLYLGGFGLELDDLKALRTWGSKTPGHPEYGHTDGVEITTGPLGQGLASSVGFAYAARYERGLFDPEAPAGKSPFDHFVYVIACDGDLQEGVTSEASSLAGHQELGNLDRDLRLQPDLDRGRHQRRVHRGRRQALRVVRLARADRRLEEDRRVRRGRRRSCTPRSRPPRARLASPSLIILKTIIGWPSPGKQNTGKIHGSALGADELAATKKVLGFDPEQTFVVADERHRAHARPRRARRGRRTPPGRSSSTRGPRRTPSARRCWTACRPASCPTDIADALPGLRGGQGRLDPRRIRHGHQRPRRRAARAVGRLRRPRRVEPHDDQGRASPSSPSEWSTHEWSGDPYGRVLHFGIREHAMGAIVNGIVLHGPTRAVRRHVPDLQRLHAPAGAPRRADEHPVALRLDARLGRARRGRPDAPADRAARDAARHPELHGRPPRPTRTRPRRRGSRSCAATPAPPASP